MKLIKIFAVMAFCTFLTGCPSMRPVDVTVTDPTLVTTPGLVTPGKPLSVGSVSASKITVKVNASFSSTNKAVQKAVEGAVARAGFTVSSSKDPYVIVNLDSSLSQFDKMGNYYLMKGEADYSVTRQDGKLLDQENVEVKGKRQLGRSKAEMDAVKALSKTVAAKVEAVCKRDVSNLKMAVINFRMELFTKAFGTEVQQVQKQIHAVLKRVAGLNGVVICNQISNDWKTVKVRVVYKDGTFPNGLVYEFVGADFKLKHSNDKVGEFVRKVFKL